MGCFFFKAPSKSLHALVRSLLTILSVPSRHWFLWVLTLISSYGTVNHASLQSTLIAKSRSQLFTTLLGGS
ncbi:hypothetical protein HDV64DRAFT_76005 [Trichoderma sp. TUCIM 5745]